MPKPVHQFKKGQTVKIAIPTHGGITRAKGTILKLIPKDAVAGAARMTVVDSDGRKWRPFASQCKAA